VPDFDTWVVTMWTMTQRAGSVSYHVLTAGTSLAILSLLYCCCEIGVVLSPSAAASHAKWAPWLSRLAGWHVAPALSDGKPDGGQRVVMKWWVLEVLGENSLAVYLISNA
jgi:hypothetical protein